MKPVIAKFPGVCPVCRAKYDVGQELIVVRPQNQQKWGHPECGPKEGEDDYIPEKEARPEAKQLPDRTNSQAWASAKKPARAWSGFTIRRARLA